MIRALKKVRRDTAQHDQDYIWLLGLGVAQILKIRLPKLDEQKQLHFITTGTKASN